MRVASQMCGKCGGIKRDRMVGKMSPLAMVGKDCGCPQKHGRKGVVDFQKPGQPVIIGKLDPRANLPQGLEAHEPKGASGPAPMMGKQVVNGVHLEHADRAFVDYLQTIKHENFDDHTRGTPDIRPTMEAMNYTASIFNMQAGKCRGCFHSSDSFVANDHGFMVTGLRCMALRGDPMVGKDARCDLWTGLQHASKSLPSHYIPNERLGKGRDGGGPQQPYRSSMPDFQEIYHQPETRESVKRERVAEEIRRRSMASKNKGKFGFHGEPPEPHLRAQPDDYRPAAQYGEKRLSDESPKPRFIPPRIFARMTEQLPIVGKARGGAYTGKGKRTGAPGHYKYDYSDEGSPKETAQRLVEKHGGDVKRALASQLTLKADVGASPSVVAVLNELKAMNRKENSATAKSAQSVQLDFEKMVDTHSGATAERVRDAAFRALDEGDEIKLKGVWIETDYVAGGPPSRFPHPASLHLKVTSKVEGPAGINLYASLVDRDRRVFITGRNKKGREGSTYKVRYVDEEASKRAFGSEGGNPGKVKLGEDALSNIHALEPISAAAKTRVSAVMRSQASALSTEVEKKADATEKWREERDQSIAREDEYVASIREMKAKEDADAAKDSAAIAKEMPASPYKGKRDTARFDAALPWLRGKISNPDGLITTAARRANVSGDHTALAKMTPDKMAAHFAKNGSDPFWAGVATAASAFKRTLGGKRQVAADKRGAKKKVVAAKTTSTIAMGIHKTLYGKPARSKVDLEEVSRFSAGVAWAKDKGIVGDRAKKIAWKKVAKPQSGKRRDDEQKREHIYTEDAFWSGVFHHGMNG